MSLSAEQVWTQVRWEQRGINQGIRRYREASLAMDPATLPPGQALLRAVVPPLVAAVEASQSEAQEAVAAGGRRRPTPWHHLIQLLPPEKIAVITASVLLRRAGGVIEEGRAVTMARTISRAIRVQVDVDRWERGMLAARVKGQWDALATFRTRFKTPNTRAWRSFSSRLENLETEAWTQVQEVHLGSYLVHLATTTCSDWFRVELERVGGKTRVVVKLSETAQETMQDLAARAELASPVRLPMIVPPLPWRYQETLNDTPAALLADPSRLLPL